MVRSIEYGEIVENFSKRICGKPVDILYQPILSLKNEKIVGYEINAALSFHHVNQSIEDTIFKSLREDRLQHIHFLLNLFIGMQLIKEKEHSVPIYIKMEAKLLQDQAFIDFVKAFLLGYKKIEDIGFIFEMDEVIHLDILSNLLEQNKLIKKMPCFLRFPVTKSLLSILGLYASIEKFTHIPILVGDSRAVEYKSLFLSYDIHYGMGQALSKDDDIEQKTVSEEMEEYVQEYKNKQHHKIQEIDAPLYIGEIIEEVVVIHDQLLGEKVNEIFENNSSIEGIPILLEEKPIGLVMRTQFYKNLSKQYGYSIFMKRPINRIMDKNPMIIDYFTPIAEASEIAMGRTQDHLYDYIIVTKNKQYAGIVTIKNLLIKTSQIQISIARYANPLTGLPGNKIIEEKLNMALRADTYSVLYFDLDNFKAYNDVYGFEKGDKVIRATANILSQNLDRSGEKSFIGHIGGDDFIAISHYSDVEKLCEEIIRNFDEAIKEFYTEKDKVRGYIVAKNRHGEKEKFPFISLSIAVVTNRNIFFKTADDLAQAAGELKKECKMCWDSCYKVI